MRRTILYYDTSPVFSGAEYCLLELINGLDRGSFDPILCFDYRKPHQSLYAPTKAKECWLADRLEWWMGSLRWKHPIRGTDCLKRGILGLRLRNRMKQFRADIMHMNLTWPWAFLELAIVRQAGFRTVAHVRSLAPHFRLPKRVLRQSDAVICVSEAVRQEVEKWGGHANLHRVYDPIDSDHYQVMEGRTEILKQFGLPADKRIISSVGLLSRHKGHDIAIQAYSRIAGEFPETILYVCGGDPSGKNSGGELERLRCLAGSLGLQERVVFSGRHVSDVEKVYSISEFILALTKYGEGFGRVAAEAGAAGKIIIATAMGATPELVLHENSGILVPVNEVEPVSRYMKTLLEDPTAYRVMEANARVRIRSCFSVERHVQGVKDVYDSLLGAIPN